MRTFEAQGRGNPLRSLGKYRIPPRSGPLLANGPITVRINQLLPAFAGKRLAAITRTDVISWFQHYSAKSRGGANRALGILGEMLARARDWGHLPQDWTSPMMGVRHNRRRVVGTFLSDGQMANLGACLDDRIRAGCVASSLLRFLTLAGCRVGEAIDLEWRNVLADRLTLRDSKTGASSKRTVPDLRAALTCASPARSFRCPVTNSTIRCDPSG